MFRYAVNSMIFFTKIDNKKIKNVAGDIFGSLYYFNLLKELNGYSLVGQNYKMQIKHKVNWQDRRNDL